MTIAIDDTSNTATRLLEVEAIRPSPRNPRKYFDPVKLSELAASIKSKGLAQPILVRPLKVLGGHTHEIVVGERRWRAHQQLGRVRIECLERDLDDDDAFDLMVIENDQRADVTPLEQARSYAEMQGAMGRTPQQIADKVGRPLKFIKQRLRLLELGPRCLEALDSGDLTLGAAMELMRLSDPAAQDEVLTEELKRTDSPWVRHANGGRRPSVSAEDISREVNAYLRDLAQAPFDTTAVDLVDGVGACGPCPKRLGNQGDLFGVDARTENRCGDGSCWDRKLKAATAIRTADARKRGLKVITALREVEDLQGYRGQTEQYVRADKQVLIGPAARVMKAQAVVKKQLGADDAKPVALAVHPQTGASFEVLDRRAVDRALKAAKPNAPVSGGMGKAGRSIGAVQRDRAEAAAVRDAIASVVLDLENTFDATTGWQAAAIAALETARREAYFAVAERRGVHEAGSNRSAANKSLEKLAATLSGAQAAALIAEIAVTEALTKWNRATRGKALLKAFDIDLGQLTKTKLAAAAVEKKSKSKSKAPAKAKAGKSSAPVTKPKASNGGAKAKAGIKRHKSEAP